MALIWIPPGWRPLLPRDARRSLRFVHETRDAAWAQPVAVINCPQSEAFARVTEYQHLTGQVHPKTSLTYQYPTDAGDPWHPIPRPENQALYSAYRAAAERLPGVWFVGRLGAYRYLNMEPVAGQASATFERRNATRASTAFARAAE